MITGRVGSQETGDSLPEPLGTPPELDSFDCSLANMREVVCGSLDAVCARSVAEVGAEHGLFTSELLEWARETGAESVVAIDPAPRERLRRLAERAPDLTLIQETSHAALAQIEMPDAVIIDGDHNYFTVREELRLIAERSPAAELPLLLLHDVGWPLARRDCYYAPDRIPPEHRQPLANQAYLDPAEAGLASEGLLYEYVAEREGGPANGVLTAVEDFVAANNGLRLAVVPSFFGLGVVWHEDAPWARAIAEFVAPMDGSPLLGRMERKRVAHLVAEFRERQRGDALRSADYELRFELVSALLPIAASGAFALAERLSQLRQRGAANFSRERLRDLVVELAGDDVAIDVSSLRRQDPPRRVAPPTSAPAPGARVVRDRA